MKKLFKFFILINTIIVSTLAICADRPVIPTTPPLTITRSSPGISNFPTSTKQFAMTLRVTPDEPCTEGSVWNIFSLSVQPPGEVPREQFLIYIDCETRTMRFDISWLGIGTTKFMDPLFSSSALGPVSIFWYLDLNTPALRIAAQTDTFLRPVGIGIKVSSGVSFDENTKFYFCSGQDGTSPRACTISELVFEYRPYESKGWPFANLGGIDPALAASYPLTDGPKTFLANSFDPTKYGYFGDKESNPTEETRPTWDPSNSFVIISAGQFLTFPLPSLLTTIYPYSSSFTFTAWVKITQLQATTATTLFSMHSADGTQVGYKMTVAQSTRQLQLSFGSREFSTVTAHTPITIQASNEWQLIGFTAQLLAGKLQTVGIIFAGASSYQFNGVDSKRMDLSPVSVIRVGGGASESFSGQISLVRILTPGAVVIKSSNLCSPDASLEFGLGSFPLACAESKMMGSVDNKCYSSCPTNTFSSSDTATPLCVPCPIHCTTCDRIECFTCEENYVLYQGNCLSSCPEKTYYNGKACQDCPGHCKACENGQCSICEANFLLYKGFCVSSCPPQTYSTSSACYDCSANCEECNNNECLTCKANYFFYKESCINSCPPRSYFDLTTCIACSDHQCIECEADGCKVCDDGYKLDTEKKCVPKSSSTLPPIRAEESGSSGGMSVGLIVGIVCGSVAAVVFTGFLVKKYLFTIKRNGLKNRYLENQISSARDPTAPVSPIQTEENELIP